MIRASFTKSVALSAVQNFIISAFKILSHGGVLQPLWKNIDYSEVFLFFLTNSVLITFLFCR